MKKRIFVLFGWLAVLMLVAAPVAVAAPTTPTADFTDNGDGTVTHKITGLTWMRCANLHKRNVEDLMGANLIVKF